jgi:hypothetical protein
MRSISVARPGNPGCPRLAVVASLLASLAALPATVLAQAAPQGIPTQTQNNAEVDRQRDFRENTLRNSVLDRAHSDAMAAQKKARDARLREALEKDQAMLAQPRELLTRLLQLPGTLKLSPEGRALAEATLQPHREHVVAGWPALQAQAIARGTDASGNRKAEIEEVALNLSARVVNEAALWFADAEPHASDAIWIEALRREGLCQGLTGTEPAARMAALIDALPAEQRAAAWSGEAARLSRWGQDTRTVLPPAERALEDGLVPALAPALRDKTLAAMPEALRAMVQAPGWTLAAQAPAQRCELLRWWGQEQVRTKRLNPRQAMLAWRTALAPRSADFLLAGVAREGAAAIDKGGYPVVARRLGLTGRVVVEQDIDASGKSLHRFIQRRELRAASLGDLPPVGLEHELDAATLARVASAPVAPPAASTLQGGTATQRVGIEWLMK